LISRVSTLDQRNEASLSPEAQFRTLNQYAEQMKFEVIARHDITESASKVDRPRFEKASSIVEKYKEPIAIITERIDRFSRGQSWATFKLDQWRREGKVELHFVKSGPLVIHRDSSAGEIAMWKVQIDFAEYESGTKRDNVNRTIKEAIQQGLYKKPSPLGYIYESGKMFQDIKRAGLIKEMFELYSSGEFTVESLTKEMGRKGLTTRERTVKGIKIPEAPVKVSDVAYALRNRTYTGSFTQVNPEDQEGPKLLIKGTNYPAIISEELFERVKKTLSDFGNKPAGSSKHDFKFSKMIKCAFCGLSLSPESMAHTYVHDDSPGAKEVYYRCSCGKGSAWYEEHFGRDHSGVHIADRGKNKGNEKVGCPQLSWKESEIEAKILKRFSSIEINQELLKKLKLELNETFQTRAKNAELDMKLLNSEDNRLRVLESALVENLVLESEEKIKASIRVTLRETQRQRDDIKAEMKMIEEAEDINIEEVISTVDLCGDLAAIYKSMNPEDQVKLVGQCFDHILAHRGEYREPKRGKAEKQGKERMVEVSDEKGNLIMVPESETKPDPADSDDPKDYMAIGGTGKKLKVNELIFLWNPYFRRLFDLGIIKAAAWAEGPEYRLPRRDKKNLTEKKAKEAFVFL